MPYSKNMAYFCIIRKKSDFCMRMYDLIEKKRDNFELSDEEIKWIITEYVKGEIPDYQMSALLMAIYFNGLNERETLTLTLEMAHSGDMMDLSAIKGIKADKHSTGGVGDKTTMIVAPIVAACGVPVAKMSGRGLGHTGGTVDKLEAIPGFRTSIDKEEFFDIVNRVGICVIGQTGNIAPADKKLYALRDVTATVNSIPLIASSIMSKKLAAGSDAIVLDVKTGSGAFMKTREMAVKLAETMVKIGEGAGRKTIALITDMDRPLGNAIGNAVEVMEAADTLRGNGPEDLTELCTKLAANMLVSAGEGEENECIEMVKNAICSGKALNKFKEMITAQGGNANCIDDYSLFDKAGYRKEILADREGYITHINTEKCGISSVILGAGRETKESCIDFSAGIILKEKIGSYVKKGDVIAIMLTNKEESLSAAEKMFLSNIVIGNEKPNKNSLIYARVDINGVELFD